MGFKLFSSGSAQYKRNFSIKFNRAKTLPVLGSRVPYSYHRIKWSGLKRTTMII